MVTLIHRSRPYFLAFKSYSATFEPIKAARELAERFDLILLEDLKIKIMVASAKGTLKSPGADMTATRGLNRCIPAAGWAQLRSILEAKAKDARRTAMNVDPRHASQTFAEC